MVRWLSSTENKEREMARILIIDDDDQGRASLRRMLEWFGYEVLDAPNGKEGIKLNQCEPADLVITHVIMPKKNGIETIMDLRREFPEVKIIAISGGSRTGADRYLELAKGFGAQCTIKKPFKLEELFKAIQEVLGDYQP